MKVINVPINSIKPYENNPRNNDQGVDAVAKSIKEFNWQQPIVVDKDNVIIVGHTRYLAAKKLGLKEVPVKIATGLTPEQVKAYRLADNKTGELTDWDDDLLESELDDILDIDMTGFGFDMQKEANDEEDNPYSQKVDAIDYQPQSKKQPDLGVLVDMERYQHHLRAIEDLDLPANIKKFLKISATRFIKFDFATIAEYYAHADKKTQEAFENELLVIVDYDKAIEKGIAEFEHAVADEELNTVGELDERLK